MPAFTVATWNVNSIKARLPRVLDWLDAAKPDVVCLQELKCIDDNFPMMEIEAAGYKAAVHGQKTYNGVAILSRHEIEDVSPRLPGNDEDEQARYIEATIKGVRIASIYLPNGNPIGGEKFDYKLAWMKRLEHRAQALLAAEKPVILAGDYNVIPQNEDCYNPAAWKDDALFQPESRAAFRRLIHLGYTEAYRDRHPRRQAYSYWDYTAGAWQKDNGIRIDHLLLSPQAADRLTGADIDKSPRGKEKPSDHTPVIVTLDLPESMAEAA